MYYKAFYSILNIFITFILHNHIHALLVTLIIFLFIAYIFFIILQIILMKNTDTKERNYHRVCLTKWIIFHFGRNKKYVADTFTLDKMYKQSECLKSPIHSTNQEKKTVVEICFVHSMFYEIVNGTIQSGSLRKNFINFVFLRTGLN